MLTAKKYLHHLHIVPKDRAFFASIQQYLFALHQLILTSEGGKIIFLS